MKYKENKLRLTKTGSAMQDFYFFVEFSFVIIYVLIAIVKNPLPFY